MTTSMSSLRMKTSPSGVGGAAPPILKIK
jgi:hypothetical protein